MSSQRMCHSTISFATERDLLKDGLASGSPPKHWATLKEGINIRAIRDIITKLTNLITRLTRDWIGFSGAYYPDKKEADKYKW